jgi:prepilin-type N-terminal cleavage/methylation domain-containing protein
MIKKLLRNTVGPGFSRAQNGEQGLTLIETLIALAILGAAAVVFLIGLTTTSKAVMVSQERVSVDSLAKSQMENINSQSYIKVADYNPNDPTKSYQLIDISPDLIAQGYAIVISPPQAVPNGDENIQSITVTVTRNGETVFTLVGYKVKP